MKKLLLTASALAALTITAQAGDLTVMSWGGAYGAAQVEGLLKPYTAKTGVVTKMVDAEDPSVPLKAQVEAKNVTMDVASVEYAAGLRLCDEGLLEKIDPAKVPAGNDGTPAAEDFANGGLTECGISTDVWSNVFAYDASKMSGDKSPKTAADFFDTGKFPGKRGLRKGAKGNLEFALMGDGVAPADVYKTLGTKEGVDRALKKLDSIKKDTVWWTAGAQPPQLLADGEVAMSTAYNGRIFDANMKEGKNFQIVWDSQTFENELFVIPKGAPNLDKAMDFILYATTTDGLRQQAQQISYGPPRKSSMKEKLLFKDGKTEMAPHLPTAPDNMKNALATDTAFWADRQSELEERFNAWLAAN